MNQQFRWGKLGQLKSLSVFVACKSTRYLFRHVIHNCSPLLTCSAYQLYSPQHCSSIIFFVAENKIIQCTWISVPSPHYLPLSKSVHYLPYSHYSYSCCSICSTHDSTQQWIALIHLSKEGLQRFQHFGKVSHFFLLFIITLKFP